MRRLQRLIPGFAAAVCGAMLVVILPASAHHSFEAEYDPGNNTNLTGVVTKVEWANPHAHVFMTVRSESGEIRPFQVELGPPYALVRGGWERNTVKIGDTITLENVSLARDGSNKAGATRASALVLQDGQRRVLR